MNLGFPETRLLNTSSLSRPASPAPIKNYEHEQRFPYCPLPKRTMRGADILGIPLGLILFASETLSPSGTNT